MSSATQRSRRIGRVVALFVVAVATLTAAPVSDAQTSPPGAPLKVEAFTQVLGRPTNRTVALSLLSPIDVEATVDLGTTAGRWSKSTATVRLTAASPSVVELTGLSG